MTTTKSLNGLVKRLRQSAIPASTPVVTDGELLADFIVSRSEAAFATLMQRHGPMIMGVCRRILRNEADAEDAFQATFLVLVRKASSLRSRRLVGNWLYGVAHNTALKARAMIQRRQVKEREAGSAPRQDPPPELGEQVQAALDREMIALPDKYRVAIVLCDLEGKTIKEAAACLGWPQGTVATRLARGRSLLGRRMSRHGVMFSVASLTATLAAGRASAHLPSQLAGSTLEAVKATAIGGATNGLVSSEVAALTEGVVKGMLLNKLKGVASWLALLGIVLGTAALLTGAVWRRRPCPAVDRNADKSAAQPVKPAAKPEITVLMKARFYEVDDTFYQKLAKAKRLSRTDLDALEEGTLRPPVAPADGESLFKAIEKQKPRVQGKEIDIGIGRENVLLASSRPITCLPSVDEVRKGGKRPQIVQEGVVIHATAQVSADRRYVRVKFTEKSTELEGTEKVQLPVDDTPDTVAAEIVFLRESEHSQVRDLPDGGTYLMPVRFRPHDAAEKSRWLIMSVEARIIIEEEERERRRQQEQKPGRD